MGLKWVVALAALLSFGWHAQAEEGKVFDGKVGLQLYSLRVNFKEKGAIATLQQTKDMGFEFVELAGTADMPADKYKALLAEKGLKPISGHVDYKRFDTEPEKVAAEAKALGLEYIGCAWIPHKDPFDEAQAKAAAAIFNKAGEACAKEGIKFFYHCHGYEFLPQADGSTMMDYLIKETNKDKVFFEMDVYWVVNPGHDPVKWLEKYPGRWALMHIKDMSKENKLREMTGKSDKKMNVVVGTGQMDWPAILKAGKATGVQWYFIEDESPTPVEQIPQSLKYLKEVKI